MIKFRPLQEHNGDWEYQPSFYLHGTLNSKYDTDLVTILNDANYNTISEYYYKGLSLPFKVINIPEGQHLCDVNGITCVLFTWKCLNINKNGMIFSSQYTGPYDIYLRQLGLIVDLRDKTSIKDAREKFNNKECIL